jgi:hypothetical protein
MKFLYHVSQPLDTFVFMGCWNKTGCAPGSAQVDVIKTLQSRHGHVKTLVLGGDNVYPDKRDDKKHYSLNRMKTGFECIRHIGFGTMLVALGNHNVAVPELRDYALSQGLTGEPTSLVVFQNKRAILTLDTNDSMPFAWIAEALQYMKTHRIEEYYVVMHEPVVGFKQKKVEVLREADALLAVLTPHPPLFLLTADVHSFQNVRIHFAGVEFRQMIVGTGGAALDALPARFSEAVEGVSGRVEVLDAQKTYGYLVVSGREATFESVRQESPKRSPSPSHGTHRSKTTRRRSRY